MDKVWIIKNPEELLRCRKPNPLHTEVPLTDEKDPAKAYSWSVLFWGGGQLYNHQVERGLYFLFLMIGFYTCIVFTVLFWRGIVQFLRGHGMSVSVYLLVAIVLLLCALIFWCMCCSNAYRVAAKARKKRFTGTGNRLLPFLCSLLLPGWGQFLNGQPLKGSVFAGLSVISYFSLVSVSVVLLVWKDLEPSSARFLIESIFTIAILCIPLIPFVWIFGSYDALKVSLEEWKKKPLWERIKMANNYRRNKIWVHRAFCQIKRTFVLVLFLVFSLIVLYNYFPHRFYSVELTSARSWLQTQGMTVLPDLLGRLFHGIGVRGV